MERSVRRGGGPLVAVAVLAVLAVLAAGLAWWWQSDRGTPLERAVALAPADAQRLTWTDWSRVRRELGADLDVRSGADEVRGFLDEAFAADLSTMSALVSSTPTLQASYKLSPATVEWELLAQGEKGAVVLLGVGDDFDADAFGDRLEELGYQRPEEEHGVWLGGAELLPRIGPDLTPELQHVAIDAERSVVRTSDSAEHLERVLAGDGGPDVDQVVEAVAAEGAQPLVAAVFTGAHACRALAMSQADDGDQARGEALVAAAGSVSPVTGFAMAADADRVRVLFSFENDDQARADADSRAVLAAGEAPGQGGSFADRFTVRSSEARGSVLELQLEPADGAYVLSDLTSGPVLFATC